VKFYFDESFEGNPLVMFSASAFCATNNSPAAQRAVSVILYFTSAQKLAVTASPGPPSLRAS